MSDIQLDSLLATVSSSFFSDMRNRTFQTQGGMLMVGEFFPSFILIHPTGKLKLCLL